MECFADYVIFDLETTGVSCGSDRVVEISGIRVKDHKAEAEFTSLVNPECHIPSAASQVNGITDDMVRDAPVFETVLKEFLEFAGDLPLVGHNIHTFDMKFIYRDCQLYFGKIPENDYADTLSLARTYLPELGHHRLTDLADHFGISTQGAHRALNDCRMNQAIYEELDHLIKKSTVRVKTCPKCGQALVRRRGKYGEFWGCGGYPDCRYTENIKQ